jgi:hypothetical protein
MEIAAHSEAALAFLKSMSALLCIISIFFAYASRESAKALKMSIFEAL